MSGKIAKIKLGNTIFSVSDNRLDKYENGFSSASVGTVPSKKSDGAIEWKSIVIPQTSWGNITGTLSNQADLFNALSGKANSSHTHTKSEITDFSHNHDERYYTEDEIDSKLNSKLNSSLKGANNGIAELDSIGKVPSSQLPSYVDDVLEFNSQSNFPSTGETGKIYIAKDTNKTYRWSGTNYVEISSSLALGETSSTAYRGDRGKIAYDHSQATHAPTNAEANQNAFSNITVGTTTIAADSKTDTFTLAAGSNVTLTPDATNDKITITATDTTYSSKSAASSGTDVSLVTTGEKYTWNNKGTYSKPSSGIPKTDLASAVQTSLGKADTALQNHQDISGKENISNKVTSWSTTTTDSHYPSEKLVKSALDGKANSSHTQAASTITGLATVATSGSYNDLSNKPTIPAAVTSSIVSGWGFTKNAGTVTSVAVKLNGAVKGTITSSGTIDLGTVVSTLTSTVTNETLTLALS